MSRRVNDPFTTIDVGRFQSRAGFSECLDRPATVESVYSDVFQSRAGFSECLDVCAYGSDVNVSCRFNPELGFLSVSTEVRQGDRRREAVVSIPCWVF